jgi:hypothetical protein
MLAKQGWRLLSKPESLCARVLKGKYYPNSDFMNAKKKRNSSHIWNAILHGREALKGGLIKRPGDGSTIRVWDDPWIPSNYHKKPIVRAQNVEVTMVSELIDDQNSRWNIEKLEESFIPSDVSAIQAIPIGRFGEDYWSWTLERSGQFSVRSCYRALAMSLGRANSISASGADESRYWNKLWKLNVPPKIRNFWWRVINGFIPCRQVLNRRHMEEVAFCKTCGADEESIFHAFFQCTWAKLFWRELKMATTIKIPELHPDSWAIDLVEGSRVSMESACVILCGCWAIWMERNAVWHGESSRSISASVKWAMETTYDLAQLGNMKQPKVPKVKSVWRKPNKGTVKINVDAGFTDLDRQGTTGVVVRDHNGRLIVGQALWYEHAASSLIMEAMAIRDGVRLALDRSFPSVEIETDAQVVLKLLEDPDGGRSEIASICQEIKELSGFVPSIKFLFVGRCANEAAHLCAKSASSFRRRCLWINYKPPFLVQVLLKDCNPAI